MCMFTLDYLPQSYLIEIPNSWENSGKHCIPSSFWWTNKIGEKSIMYLLRMYNSKKHSAWDENIDIIQHSCNKALYNSTEDTLFRVCLGFHALAPINITYLVPPPLTPLVQKEIDNRGKFIAHIQPIQQQVRTILQKINAMYRNTMITIKCHANSKLWKSMASFAKGETHRVIPEDRTYSVWLVYYQ